MCYLGQANPFTEKRLSRNNSHGQMQAPARTSSTPSQIEWEPVLFLAGDNRGNSNEVPEVLRDKEAIISLNWTMYLARLMTTIQNFYWGSDMLQIQLDIEWPSVEAQLLRWGERISGCISSPLYIYATFIYRWSSLSLDHKPVY